MREKPRWRQRRDEIAELVTAFKMRNVLLAELVAQRVANQIRSIVGTSFVDAGTSERGTATGTATRTKRSATNADVDAGSRKQQQEAV